MGIGLKKRIFGGKKNKDDAKTNSKTKTKTKTNPATPPTQQIKERDNDNEKDHDDANDELPVKNLLDDLNIYEHYHPTTNDDDDNNDNNQNHMGSQVATGDVELVLGDFPNDEQMAEGMTQQNTNQSILPAASASLPSTPPPPPAAAAAAATTIIKDVPEIERSQTVELSADDIDIKSIDSPLRPRRLDPDGASPLVGNDDIDKDDDIIAKDLKATIPSSSQENNQKNPDIPNVNSGFSATLFGMMERAKSCAGDMMVEPIEKLLPTVDNACLPLSTGIGANCGVGDPSSSSPSSNNNNNNNKSGRPPLVRQYSYYDRQFALKILDELVNVGYALVHHQEQHLEKESVKEIQKVAEMDGNGNDNDDDNNNDNQKANADEGDNEHEDINNIQVEKGDLAELEEDACDWIGRSVTVILRPGICNRLQIQAPYLEWTTLGGGQSNVVETTTVSLLDIHSILSSAEETRMTATTTSTTAFQKEETKEECLISPEATADGQEDPQETEDLQCFFSITTKTGQIYVMEAITPDESQRLVAGIKNLASRLSSQLISGDPMVLSDFFEYSMVPPATVSTSKDIENDMGHQQKQQEREEEGHDSEDLHLSREEAMIRLSNAFLDFMEQS